MKPQPPAAEALRALVALRRPRPPPPGLRVNHYGNGTIVRNGFGFVTMCRLTLYTILMHHYAAALSAGNVINGIRGRRSGFVRTPKRVHLSD